MYGDPKPKRIRLLLLLLIMMAPAFLRVLYINEPFVDAASWRQADDATIADNFFRGNLNIFCPKLAGMAPGRTTWVTNFS
jgi:hypothetical protein